MKILVFKRFPHPARLIAMAATGFASIVLLMTASLSASAAIKCNGQFQIIKGHGQISTPYCEDNYLAAIARSYGWKVSDRAIRQNPNLKAKVCRHIGHDSRVRILCSDHIDGNDRGEFPF